MSFSPAKKPQSPPVLGTVLASSTRALPEVAEFSIAVDFIPSTASPYSFIALPKGTIFSAKSSISFSPTIAPSQPPLLGILAANSARALPAVADSVTAAASSPSIAVAYSFIAEPKATILSLKAPMSFSPTILERKPPSFGMVAAISAKALPALAALSTVAPSKSPSSSPNSFIAVPKGTISAANFVSEDSPPRNLPIASRILAPVRIRIVSARVLTPFIELSSMFFIPSKKG